jgi:tRNA nucleotidyltransferase (CCA-adding enzyme)
MSPDSVTFDHIRALPLEALRGALGSADAYLVGGTVRELVAGRPLTRDLDVAVDADLDPILERLGLPARRHARFETATVHVEGQGIDLARTRTERYPHPGALPEVEPAGIEADLARRDFTVNAMALPLREPAELLDPFGGAADLEAGTLRVLHERSFADDATRAIRAARYAARLDLAPDADTLALLREADLSSVSADRRDAELARLAGEEGAARGFALLGEWGLLEVSAEAVATIEAVDRIAAGAGWGSDGATRSRAILLAALGGARADAAAALAGAVPQRASEGVRLAAGHQPAELLLAIALGGDWLQQYVDEWSRVRLEIDGEDLMAAGIPEGPAIGAGLRAALERKLDGGLHGGREAELEAALEGARGSV